MFYQANVQLTNTRDHYNNYIYIIIINSSVYVHTLHVEPTIRDDNK